jgi:hypothetical protein
MWKIRERVFSMSVEAWKTVFDIGTLVLLFFTFAFAAGIFFTGDTINKRQEEKLRQFDKDLTEAKTELGKQQERAATAERTLLELQERIRPRSLTITQGDASIAALKKFANQKFVFTMYQDDKEVTDFAAQINAVLHSAGWKMEPTKGFLAFMLETNISIRIDPGASGETKKAADAFILAFNEQGVPTTKQLAPGPTGEPDTIQVRVGKKP